MTPYRTVPTPPTTDNTHYTELASDWSGYIKLESEKNQPGFVANSQDFINLHGIGYALNPMDISNVKKATVFLENKSESPVTFNLEYSPDLCFFAEDKEKITLGSKESKIVSIETLAQAFRLRYEALRPATFTVYYNGLT